jgi:sensor histidine kinase YesM
MTKKVGVLFVGFIALFYVLHLAYDLPNLIHGNAAFEWLPAGFRAKVHRGMDIGMTFLFALLPYLILFRLYPSGRFIQIVVLTLLAIVVIFFVHYNVTLFFLTGPLRLRTFFFETLFFDCVFVLYAIIFYFVRSAYYRELQQKELLMQNRSAELMFLRSQLNPHFLFNSLNNIYSLVYANSGQALSAISGLSELLRYMLYNTDEKVPLEKELEYIRKYISLQKLRYEYNINAELFVTGPVENITIAPLVLIPFIENAFKHGDFTGDNPSLVITVQADTNKLAVFCMNKKGKHNKDSAGGIGLENVKRRLQLLYPGKHTLRIDNHADSFAVNLELIYD